MEERGSLRMIRHVGIQKMINGKNEPTPLAGDMGQCC